MSSNPIKHNLTPIPNTLGRNNMYLDIDQYSYGDTGISGWWSGYTPPDGGYTIYIDKPSEGPSIYAPAGDSELVAITIHIAKYFNDDPSSITSADTALSYISGKSDVICVNIDYPRLKTAGMLFLLDAGFTLSYPRTGTTWYDVVSGNINNSQIINSPEFDPNSSGTLVFNGIDQYVTVNSNADILSKTSYTKIVWFYVNSFTTDNNLVSGGSTGEHAFWLYGSDKLNAGHNGVWDTVTSTTTLLINTWYCGAVTFSSTGGWKLYLDGVLEATSTDTTQFTGNGDISIASFQNGGNLFTGKIGLACVYNSVLSDSEILRNYNALYPRFADAYDILFEDGSVMQAENGDLIEYEH